MTIHTSLRRFKNYLPDFIEALGDISQLNEADVYEAEQLISLSVLQFMEFLGSGPGQVGGAVILPQSNAPA